MSMYKNLTTICAAAALALGLAACGGGGGGSGNQADMTPPPDPTPPPMEYDVALPAGHGLADGTTTIDAGETVMLSSGTYLTCPGPADCTLTVSTDGVTGASSASSTGGMVAVTTASTRMAADEAAAAEALRLAEAAVVGTQAALTAAQEAYEAGTGTRNAVTAAEEAHAMAVEHRDSLLPPVVPPMPVAASGSLVIPAAAQGELAYVLPNPGDTDTIDIPAGETVYRRGVGFTCDSAYDCTVTVTNSLGAIVASWSSEELEDGDMAGVTAMYASGGIMSPHGLPVTQANLVTYFGWSAGDLPASGQRVTRTIPAGQTRRIGNGDFSCPAGGPDCRVNIANTLGNYSIWWTRAEVTVAWTRAPDLPPVDTFAELNDGSAASIGAVTALAFDTPAAAGPPATPRGAYSSAANHAIGGMGLGDSGANNFDGFTLTGNLDPNGPAFVAAQAGPPVVPAVGSAISVATDEIDASSDMASLPGWDVKALFRDWGDTAGTGDGGFETGALIASDIVGPTAQPFDANLGAMFANANAQATFNFTVLANGGLPGAGVAATSVAIPTNPGTVQLANIVLDGGALVPAQDQDLNVNATETFAGTYFGAPGQYQCYDAAQCGIMRNADGTVGFADAGAAAGFQAGTWTFTPDSGAMIMVPDQDWMVFGAWLTTPDLATGTHRMGVFFNGMDTYTHADAQGNNLFTVGATGLNGSATYSGGAAGVYRDGTAAGLFTAEANLTANFDVDGDGVADAGDYTLSGRIDNFRGTDGVYLGDDTQGSPNHPTAGENDWVVSLGQVNLANIGAGTGTIPATATAGSADGVPWVGNWSGQLYGPDTDATGGMSPTGIAGQFQSGNASTSVVGAFGAQRD